MQKEKRTVPRISANVGCVVIIDNGKHAYQLNGMVKDISNEGICVVLDNADKVYDLIRESCSISISFTDPIGKTLSKETTQINLLSRWIHKENGHVFVGGLY